MTQQPAEPSEPKPPKLFNPIIALQGGHRPFRVVLHGLSYLIGFPVLVLGLRASGAIQAILRALRHLGLSSTIVGMFPTLLVLTYLLLWAWFLTSLFNCARNAETPWGMKVARSTATFLGVASVAVIIVITAISFVR